MRYILNRNTKKLHVADDDGRYLGQCNLSETRSADHDTILPTIEEAVAGLLNEDYSLCEHCADTTASQPLTALYQEALQDMTQERNED